MLPLCLKIKGIYSYIEPQEIDFKKLTSANLFGIFGQTGSGKSAILEAITFSLFGESERLNNRDNRAYNMMNLKCRESLIEFDFEAPNGKGFYKAKVEGKRNRNKFEDVKFERKLYRKESSNYVPIETAEIEKILGIDYQNFKRTIIIPQGKFQDFLQLTPTARNVMLMDLFNLHKFDLQQNTAILWKKVELEIAEITARISQIGEVSQESLNRKKEELEKLLQQLSNIEKDLQQKRTQESEWSKIAALFHDLSNQQQQFSALQNQEKEIIEKEISLKNYETCFFQFKNSLDQLDQNAIRINEITAAIEKSKSESALVENALATATKQLATAQKAFEERGDLNRKAENLKNVLLVAGLLQDIEKQENKIKEESQLLETKKLEQAQFTASMQDIELKIVELSQSQPNIIDLQQINDWFNQKNLFQAKLAELHKNNKTLNDEIAEMKQNLHELFVKHAINQSNSISTELTNRKEDLQTKLDNLLKDMAHLAVQRQLNEFGSQLFEGKPCLLCGSLNHPNIIDLQDIEKQFTAFQSEKLAMETHLKTISGDLVAVQLVKESYEKRKNITTKLNTEIRDLQFAVENHQKLFVWKNFDSADETLIKAEWLRFHQIQELLAAQNVRLKAIQSQRTDNEKNITAILESTHQIAHDISGKRSVAESRKSQIPATDFDENLKKPTFEIQSEIQRLETLFLQCGQQFSQAQKLRDELFQKSEPLKAALSQQIQQLTEIHENQKKTLEQLKNQILESPFENETVIRQIVSQNIDLEATKNQIQQFRNQFTALELAIQKLQVQIGSTPYLEAEYVKLKAELHEIETLGSKINQEKGRLENEFSRLQKALAASKDFSGKLTAAQLRFENIKVLSYLFKGQAFANYVSRVHLHNLTQMANERFYKLTRQQLQLELDDENNFIIRDYLNENQLRSVKTLSGGQLFQASLCLALALTDNLQQQNQSTQSFFFLDEGFGTLDSESLSLVYETLKSLQHENRIVGIISHVTDLQQEIGVWLQINQSETSGSQIQASWE